MVHECRLEVRFGPGSVARRVYGDLGYRRHCHGHTPRMTVAPQTIAGRVLRFRMMLRTVDHDGLLARVLHLRGRDLPVAVGRGEGETASGLVLFISLVMLAVVCLTEGAVMGVVRDRAVPAVLSSL